MNTPFRNLLPTAGRRRGFTLIELLVVILILGILAALIVPRLVSRSSDAKIAKAQTDIRTLSGLLDQFRIDCGRYPTTEEGLQALRSAPSDLQGQWKGPYTTKELPQDPWGNEYVYEEGGNDDFAIVSYGRDGAPGGEGENADIGEGGEQ